MIRSSLSIERRKFLSTCAWSLWLISPLPIAINLVFLAKCCGLLPADAVSICVCYVGLIWPVFAIVPLVAEMILLPTKSSNEGESVEG